MQGVGLAKDLKQSDGTRYWREQGWNAAAIDHVLQNLNVDQNKLLILNLMRRGDWLALMRLMDKDVLVLGLHFLSKPQILRMLNYLPKALLIKMLMSVMNLKQLVNRMPLQEIMTILRSDRLPVRELVERMMVMQPKFLRQLMAKITGQSVNNLSPAEMRPMFLRMKKHKLLDGLRTLPFKALQPLMMECLQKDPQLLMAMSDSFLFRQFELMDKPQLVNSFMAMDKDMLLQLFGLMPDSFLIQVASLADTSLFTQFLKDSHTDLLAWLGQQALALSS